RRRSPLSPRRERRGVAGRALIGVLSREGPFRAAGPTETRQRDGEGVGLSGGRQRPALPPGPRHTLVLRRPGDKIGRLPAISPQPLPPTARCEATSPAQHGGGT